MSSLSIFLLYLATVLCGYVNALNITTPTSNIPWGVQQTNIISWTNATWNVTRTSYPLGQPFNVSIGMPGQDALLLLGLANGTEGLVGVDMSNWTQQGTYRLIFAFNYNNSLGYSAGLAFGESTNFEIIKSPFKENITAPYTLNVTATGLGPGNQTSATLTNTVSPPTSTGNGSAATTTDTVSTTTMGPSTEPPETNAAASELVTWSILTGTAVFLWAAWTALTLGAC